MLNSYTYDAFGNTLSYAEKVSNRFMYAGEQFDKLTGQYYLRARHYQPGIGRFVQEDSYRGEITDPLSLHLYTYVTNNPIMYIDPTGHMNYFTQTHHFVLGYGAGVIEVYNDNQPNPFMKLGFNPLDEINKTIQFYQSLYDLGHGLYTGNIGLDELEEMIGQHISDTLRGDLTYIMDNHEILKCGVKATNEEVYEFGKRVPRAIEELAQIGLTVVELGAIVKNGIKRGFSHVVKEGAEEVAEDSFIICFTGETLINTEHGHKQIEDVEVGDKVYSENVETGEKGYKSVKQIFVNDAHKLLNISVKNTKIKTTFSHPFYVVNRGWIEAEDLKVGDVLKLANGETAEIKALVVEELENPVKVYNFEVENWHTYYVSEYDILVHNTGSNPCAEGAGNGGITAGKNFKDHFINHKKILEDALGTKYPKYKTDGSRFLEDIGKIIDDGTVEFVGQGTLKKGTDICNIYRGNGMTVVTKPNGEFVTILEQGKGMDLGIQFVK